MMNARLSPILKWVGGKRQLLPELTKRLPKQFNHYYEPFIGGGAMLFHIMPDDATINDLNQELTNLYTVIRDNPDELKKILSTFTNDKSTYESIRDVDLDCKKYATYSDEWKAARTIYLNKTCFNGLYRVNKDGHFNVPYNNNKNANYTDFDLIDRLSKYFNTSNITILNGDYKTALNSVKAGDFVYLDPPYDVEVGTSEFTAYTTSPFGTKEQQDLKQFCDELTKKGVYWMQSNSATSFIKALYSDNEVDEVTVNRSINSNASNRKKSNKEVIIRNYKEC